MISSDAVDDGHYLRVESLTKTFPGDGQHLAAVSGISFSVAKGELFTLLGPSGCGKRTTLRCIAGLERPDGGVITVDGQAHVDAARGVFVPPDQRGIGMVFQSYAIWPHMTVYENVAYALEVKRTPRSETFVTVTGKGYRPNMIDLGRWRYAASLGALLILTLMVVLPVVMLFLTSLLPYYHVPTLESVKLMSLKHYAYVFQNDRVYDAIGNSLILAIGGATIAMALASVTAYITVKTKVRGRGLLEGMTFLPWAFPSTALAIGLL